MLEDVVRLLACPVCREPLTPARRSLVCTTGHSFDIARQGYVNLLQAGSPAHASDTAAMVAARAAFLGASHYAPVADAVTSALVATTSQPASVLDVGAGTGYYLAAVLTAAPQAVGLALDLSVPAARRAARCHPRAGAAVADTWQSLPVRDRSVDAVLNVFAPRNLPEFHRVLVPSGSLVIVTPTAHHLQELREPLGLLEVQGGKDDRLSAAVSGGFEQVEQRHVDVPLRLSHREVADLVAMGPNAWHTEEEARRRRIASLPEPVTVTAGVRVGVYRRR